MKAFFLGFGGVLLGVSILLFVLAVIVWVLWRKVCRWASGLFDGFADFLGGHLPPRITLVPLDPRQGWFSDGEPQPIKLGGEFESICEAFRAAGFANAGLFKIEETFGLLVNGFADPDRGLWAAVYSKYGFGGVLSSSKEGSDDQDSSGPDRVWYDIVSISGDQSLTHTSTSPTGMDRPKVATLVRVEGMPVEQAVAQHCNDRSSAPDPSDPGRFTEVFTDQYAREMDWRMLRGVTIEEARRSASLVPAKVDPKTKQPRTPTEDEIMFARLTMLRQLSADLDEMFRKQILEDEMVSAADWDQYGGGMVFVHDHVFPELMASTLEDVFDLGYERMPGFEQDQNEEKQEKESEQRRRREWVIGTFRDGSPREIFQEMNAKLSDNGRFRHFGQVIIKLTNGSLEADVYARLEYSDRSENALILGMPTEIAE